VHSRLSPTPKIHCNFELKLTRLSSLTQIIVKHHKFLDTFAVVTDILNFLEASSSEWVQVSQNRKWTRGWSEHVQMERRLELLEFLSTLINTTKENIVIMNKETLQSMITCLQVMQTKVIILQEQSHLLNDDLIELKIQ
jgi:hypothetical protein